MGQSEVLQTLKSTNKQLTIKEISEITGIGKTGVRNSANQLVKYGLARRASKANKYKSTLVYWV